MENGYKVWIKGKNNQRRHKSFLSIEEATEWCNSNNGNYISQIGNRSPNEIRQWNEAHTFI